MQRICQPRQFARQLDDSVQSPTFRLLVARNKKKLKLGLYTPISSAANISSSKQEIGLTI